MVERKYDVCDHNCKTYRNLIIEINQETISFAMPLRFPPTPTCTIKLVKPQNTKTLMVAVVETRKQEKQ